MSNLKERLIVFALVLGVFTVTGCAQKQASQTWEYKVVLFQLDTSTQMDAQLKTVGDDGWEYAGTLTNNGMNARYVAFKRPKQ